jgi:hypothetical protein
VCVAPQPLRWRLLARPGFLRHPVDSGGLGRGPILRRATALKRLRRSCSRGEMRQRPLRSPDLADVATRTPDPRGGVGSHRSLPRPSRPSHGVAVDSQSEAAAWGWDGDEPVAPKRIPATSSGYACKLCPYQKCSISRQKAPTCGASAYAPGEIRTPDLRFRSGSPGLRFGLVEPDWGFSHALK